MQAALRKAVFVAVLCIGASASCGPQSASSDAKGLGGCTSGVTVPAPTLDANDTFGLAFLCATNFTCSQGMGTESLSACVNAHVGFQLFAGAKPDPRELALAQCAAATPGDCQAIANCYLGPVEKRVECNENPTGTFCDGTRLVQCAGVPEVGGPLDVGDAHVLDCAHPTGALLDRLGGTNPNCVVGAQGAKCGVSSCDGCGGYAGGGGGAGQPPCTASPPPACDGDRLSYCRGDSVLVQQDCSALDMTCSTAMTATCVSPTSCSASQDAYHCEGSKVIVECAEGTTHEFADCGKRNGWTCHPGGITTDVWTVCGPVSTQCTVAGGASPSHCQGDDVAFCVNGEPATFSCAAAGLGPCKEFSAYTGAWCTPLKCSSQGTPGNSTATVIQIGLGATHSCAVTADGTLSCWGNNMYYQLGDGSTESKLVPAPVAGITSAKQVSGATHQTCVVLTDGTVKCWGDNDAGQVGDGSNYPHPTPIEVPGLASVTQIAAGMFQTCALEQDGSVECWGANMLGQLGDGTTLAHTTPAPVSGLAGVVQIVSGDAHNCALSSAGAIFCWGRNQFGQIGDGTTTDRYTPTQVVGLTGVLEIDVGDEHGCARMADGTVQCWGLNASGQLGDGTTQDRSVPTGVVDLAGVVQISAGGSHTCARTSDGLVRCWGEHFNSAAAGSSPDHLITPTVMTLPGPASLLDTGWLHSCAKLVDESIWCWGRNCCGQLGDGTSDGTAVTPTRVAW